MGHRDQGGKIAVADLDTARWTVATAALGQSLGQAENVADVG
jgi:hypothetical protein